MLQVSTYRRKLIGTEYLTVTVARDGFKRLLLGVQVAEILKFTKWYEQWLEVSQL